MVDLFSVLGWWISQHCFSGHRDISCLNTFVEEYSFFNERLNLSTNINT